MIGLKRNQRTFFYMPYQGSEELLDEYGNRTGELKILYGPAVEARYNVSAATGISQTKMFGNLDSYDKVIAPLPVDFPIAENDVLFVDKAPEYDDDGNPKYDYIVRRIARSLNFTSVAIRKVKVS